MNHVGIIVACLFTAVITLNVWIWPLLEAIMTVFLGVIIIPILGILLTWDRMRAVFA